MDAAVERALDAIRRGDWEAVRLALHRYMRWTCPDGTEVRGRNRVLRMLADAPAPQPPAAVELRDGQIYRWSG